MARRRRRLGDPAETHREKGASAAKQVHELAREVANAAAGGQCHSAYTALLNLNLSMGRVIAHASSGGSEPLGIRKASEQARKVFTSRCAVTRK